MKITTPIKTKRWVRAYWFSRSDGTTEYQSTPVSVGIIHQVDGDIVPCKRGLHASPTAWDGERAGKAWEMSSVHWSRTLGVYNDCWRDMETSGTNSCRTPAAIVGVPCLANSSPRLQLHHEPTKKPTPERCERGGATQ